MSQHKKSHPRRRAAKPAPTPTAPIPTAPPNGILWGAAAIGSVIQRSPSQANHLLAIGAIECASKRGALWCADAAALRKEFKCEVES